MKNIIYSKCATERKKEYRIITSIIEEHGEKYVCKKPLNKYSEKHINRMYDVYANDIWENKKLCLAPCKKLEDNSVLFEYVEGHTLLEKLEDNAQKKEWQLFIESVKAFKEMIYDVNNKQSFHYSDLFEAYFGKAEGLEGYEAAEFLNIDLLPENIILKEDKYYVIDYEWIMPFVVPLKYVMFRIVFFSPVFGRVPKDIRDEILNIVEISKKEWELFLQMEIHFQSQVSDSSLDELYKKMPQDVFYTNNQNIEMKRINCILAKDEDGNELYQRFSREITEKIVFSTKKEGKVNIELTSNPCIIKIKNLKINNIECNDFKTNSLLQIVDDYYFAGKAEVEITVAGQAEISLKYSLLENPNDTLISLINVLKQNSVFQLEKMELEKWNKAYASRIQELEHELQEKVNGLSSELLQVGNERSLLVQKIEGLSNELLQVGDERSALVQRINELTTELLQVGDERAAINAEKNRIERENELLREELINIKAARGWNLYSKMNKLD